MTKLKKWWVRVKAKPLKVPDAIKQEVSAKADALVEKHLRYEYVKPPPKNPKFNYIEDISTRWLGPYFYFMAKYAFPPPNCNSPSFEVGFARIEFFGDFRFGSDNPFGLASLRRHSGEWTTIFYGLTLDKALNLVETGTPWKPIQNIGIHERAKES